MSQHECPCGTEKRGVGVAAKISPGCSKEGAGTLSKKKRPKDGFGAGRRGAGREKIKRFKNRSSQQRGVGKYELKCFSVMKGVGR